MNVLFIKITIGVSDNSTFDAGIGSISAYLKTQGHNVTLFVFNSWKEKNDLFQRIQFYQPDFICYSAVASVFPNIQVLSTILKKKYPHIHQICGGVHITICPHDFFHAKSIDSICLGEGEYALAAYIDNYQHNTHYYTPGFWVRKKQKIIQNPPSKIIQNLDNLPFSDRDIFSRQGLQPLPPESSKSSSQKGIEFILSRGCPYGCAYCSNHALKSFYGSTFYRKLSPQRAIDEILFVLKEFRTEYITFHDDTFTLDHRWLSEFLRLYKANIHIPFHCNIRVGTTNAKIFKQLKNAGCSPVKIGLESGDESIRSKVLNRFMKNEDIIKTFTQAKRAGLYAFAFTMMGLPDETPQKFLNTIKLLAQCNPTNYVMYIFYPYKGTQLYTYCINKGYIKNLKPISNTFVERMDTLLNMPQFPRNDILYYHKIQSYLYELYRQKMFSNAIFSTMKTSLLLCLNQIPPSSRYFLVTQTLLKILYYTSFSFIKNIQMIPVSKQQ